MLSTPFMMPFSYNLPIASSAKLSDETSRKIAEPRSVAPILVTAVPKRAPAMNTAGRIRVKRCRDMINEGKVNKVCVKMRYETIVLCKNCSMIHHRQKLRIVVLRVGHLAQAESK